MTPILLIDHGGCTHVEKVSNAMKAGLKAAIIMEDDSIEDYHLLRKSQQHSDEEESKLGYELNIPYFKIFGSDGNTLRKYLSASDAKAVYLRIDLGLANPDNRVEYELWYSSILDLNVEAIKELGEYQKPFGKDALFTPRIVTFSCELCPKEVREANCISDGKYC